MNTTINNSFKKAFTLFLTPSKFSAKFSVINWRITAGVIAILATTRYIYSMIITAIFSHLDLEYLLDGLVDTGIFIILFIFFAIIIGLLFYLVEKRMGNTSNSLELVNYTTLTSTIALIIFKSVIFLLSALLAVETLSPYINGLITSINIVTWVWAGFMFAAYFTLKFKISESHQLMLTLAFITLNLMIFVTAI